MITTKKNNFGYFNEITQYLDKYLILDPEWSHTYIYEKPIGDTWLIRIPGATIGKLKIKNNIIEDINLYEDDCIYKLRCYDKSVLENLNQFIGEKITFKKNENN